MSNRRLLNKRTWNWVLRMLAHLCPCTPTYTLLGKANYELKAPLVLIPRCKKQFSIAIAISCVWWLNTNKSIHMNLYCTTAFWAWKDQTDQQASREREKRRPATSCMRIVFAYFSTFLWEYTKNKRWKITRKHSSKNGCKQSYKLAIRFCNSTVASICSIALFSDNSLRQLFIKQLLWRWGVRLQ